MTASSAINCTTKFLVCISLLSLFSAAGCRRSRSANSNSPPSATAARANDPEEAKRQAQTLIKQGKDLQDNYQDEQAVETFKQAVIYDPNNAEAHLRLGMSYAALDQKPEAEDEYKKSIELFKKIAQSSQKDADAFFYLGEAHSFLHQDEEAARAYRQATKLKSDDEEAFYQLGMAETRLAHYPEATAAFEKALEIDPNDYRASDAIENAKEGTQRIKEGRKHAEDMLKKQSANGNSNNNSNTAAKPVPRPSPRKPW
ncbi:MAG: tetratricopeptide repeat protein [Pyrinomonadaceae bacterium]